MPSWMSGWPFAVAYVFMFVVVLLRAQGTYWLGRGVNAGVLHSRWSRRLSGLKMTHAIAVLHRWGGPVIPLSFLTVGFQTMVNAGAGLIRMSWLRYTLWMIPGCLAWALIYSTIGFAAWTGAVALAAQSPYALAAVIAILLAGAAVVVLRRRSASRAATAGADRAAAAGADQAADLPSGPAATDGLSAWSAERTADATASDTG